MCKFLYKIPKEFTCNKHTLIISFFVKNNYHRVLSHLWWKLFLNNTKVLHGAAQTIVDNRPYCLKWLLTPHAEGGKWLYTMFKAEKKVKNQYGSSHTVLQMKRMCVTIMNIDFCVCVCVCHMLTDDWWVHETGSVFLLFSFCYGFFLASVIMCFIYTRVWTHPLF